MKPCEYYIELLSAGLDGMLTQEQELELAEHLANCPACRELGPQLVAAHAAFTQMEELEAPEGFAQGVMDRVRESAKPKVVPFFRRGSVRSIGALAACAVLCVGLLHSGGLENLMDNAASGAAAPAASMPTASAPAVYEMEDMEKSGAQFYAVDGAAPAESVAADHTGTEGQVNAEQEPAVAGKEDPCIFLFANQQVLRVSWQERTDYPTAQILGSVERLRDFLATFPDDDLTGVEENYGEDYFTTGRLLAVVVEASSGSNTYELGRLYREQVTVLEHVPEIGTCDMALWLILAEVDESFCDGAVLDVHLE